MTVVLRWAPIWVCVSFACGPAQSTDPGLDALMRVAGAQLIEAPLPIDAGGPPISIIEIPSRRVHAGRAGYVVGGRAGRDSFAVHLGLDGDHVHWVLPVGLPDDIVPHERRFDASLSFSRKTPSGEASIGIVAVDSAGNAGPAQRAALTVVTDTSTSPLQVELRWDRQVDLDLHVVTPSGIDINAKNVNAFEPPAPGQPPAHPDASLKGARLDFDSNANCVIDGLRAERVHWPTAPEHGEYVVYVDMFSTCGAGAASFDLRVIRRGDVIRHVRGTLDAFDARTHPLGPGAAPGLRATEFAIEE